MKKLLTSLALTSALVATASFAAPVVKINFSHPKKVAYLDMAINGFDMAKLGKIVSVQKVTPNSDFNVNLGNDGINIALLTHAFILNSTNTLSFYECSTQNCSALNGVHVGSAIFNLTGSNNAYKASPSEFNIHLN